MTGSLVPRASGDQVCRNRHKVLSNNLIAWSLFSAWSKIDFEENHVGVSKNGVGIFIINTEGSSCAECLELSERSSVQLGKRSHLTNSFGKFLLTTAFTKAALRSGTAISPQTLSGPWTNSNVGQRSKTTFQPRQKMTQWLQDWFKPKVCSSWRSPRRAVADVHRKCGDAPGQNSNRGVKINAGWHVVTTGWRSTSTWAYSNRTVWKQCRLCCGECMTQQGAQPMYPTPRFAPSNPSANKLSFGVKIDSVPQTPLRAALVDSGH